MITIKELKTVAYAMAKGGERPYLEGIYIESTPELIKLTATDGARLAHIEIKSASNMGTFSHTIPSEIVKQIIATKANNIFINWDKETNKATATCDNTIIKYIAADTTFPDYNRTIPKEKPGFIVRYNRKYLMDLLKALPDSTVDFLIADEFAPCRIKQEDSIHLLMPVRR